MVGEFPALCISRIKGADLQLPLAVTIERPLGWDVTNTKEEKMTVC